MSSSAPAMVVSDLDGTLLGADGLVSPRNAAALARAKAAGARIVIATGRPVYNLGALVASGFVGTAVCMNGAVVYDVGHDQVKTHVSVAPAEMTRFVATLTKLGVKFALAVERGGTRIKDFWAEAGYEHPWNDVKFPCASRAEILSGPATKLLVRYVLSAADLLTEVRAVTAAAVSVTDSSGNGLLEVAAAGVSKGATLAGLARGWGVPASEVIAFGDMPNDLDMLTWAGRSVAMANAHPAVAAVADEIGPDHAADGVARVLERWF